MCQQNKNFEIGLALVATTVGWLVLISCYLANRVPTEGTDQGGPGAFFALVVASFLAMLFGFCVGRNTADK
jgi:uncharacterized BrkB/YihY/UPF0761 family membrane protein